MIERLEWLNGADGGLQAAFAVRLEVFCREQGYSPDMELDGQDKDAWHLILWEGEEPAATGRVYWKGPDTVGLGRIAVRKPWRGQGMGRRVLLAMEEKEGAAAR